MLCIVFNKDLFSFVYYCKSIMKQNINIIPSIFTFSSIKNIIIARISQIRHFQKFIGIWKRYRKNDEFPILFQLQTINRCNANCPMCPYGTTTANEAFKIMDDKVFKKIINEISKRKEVELIVMSFQNEPLADKKLIERAKYIKSIAPHINLELVSNGFLLTPEIAHDIYNVFDEVELSIHAVTSKTHKEVLGGLDFKKTMKNIFYIGESTKMKSKTVLRFVKQRANENEYSHFKKFWRRNGFAVLGFDLNSRLNAVKDYDKMKYREKWFQLLEIKFLKMISPLFFPHCPIPNSAMYIRSNGDVVFCFSDWTEDNILGNINNESIYNVFHSSKMKQLRERINSNSAYENDICKKCDLYNEGVYLTF